MLLERMKGMIVFARGHPRDTYPPLRMRGLGTLPIGARGLRVGRRCGKRMTYDELTDFTLPSLSTTQLCFFPAASSST